MPLYAGRGQERRAILSLLIVKRGQKASEAEFAAAVTDVLGMLNALDRDGHPVPPEGPPVRMRFPPEGLELEARASRGAQSLVARRLKLFVVGLASWAVLKFGIRLGGFDPAHYRRQTTQNTDFRKFDDGLRMTIDCSPEMADRVERRLGALRERGLLSFGAFRQKEALVTCIVPNVMHDDHMHFVDGAGGGYALAARMLKGEAPAA